MRKIVLSLAIFGLALPLLGVSPAQAQSRTWVSGVGDDGFACSRTAPCKTFAGALAKTAPGGEINCLDPGGFGTVTITFSLTISCEIGTAGVVGVPMSNTIIINAGTTDVVTLRGIDIDGQSVGNSGIVILQAQAVQIEKCIIRNFRTSGSQTGIITLGGSTIFLYVTDSTISSNGYGIYLASTGGFKVASLKNVAITGSTANGLELASANEFVNVTKSIISGNGGNADLAAATGTTVNIDRSTIANNAVALNAGVSGSTIRISGNNIYNNTTGFSIAGGAFIQSDSSNNTGGSNGGATTPNAALAKN